MQTTTVTHYQFSRKRSPAATAVISAFSTVASAVALSKSVDRDELFERYDHKLWTYDDQLALFTVTTIPSILALVAIYVAFCGIRGFGRLFSSRK